MAGFTFRGTRIDIVMDLDDLDLDAAEMIEEEFGFDDLGAIYNLPKIRMMKTLALISARGMFPDATMAEIGKIKVSDLIAAIGADDNSAEPVRVVEFTGAVHTAAAVTEGSLEAGDEVLSPINGGSAD